MQKILTIVCSKSFENKLTKTDKDFNKVYLELCEDTIQEESSKTFTVKVCVLEVQGYLEISVYAKSIQSIQALKADDLCMFFQTDRSFTGNIIRAPL